MTVFVGTSGWQYDAWRDQFYPDDLPRSRWLEHYASAFRTVEVNNAFYRLPEPATFERWAERSPTDFIFAVKASRYLTHVKRLADPAQPTARLVERARHLGSKLGPILVQLPPTLGYDPERLANALDRFPTDIRIAVEFRHPSWFVDDTRCILERRGAALCLADAPHRSTPLWRTSDWAYLRLHEGRASPKPCYGRRALMTWAERLAGEWTPEEDVYVYFNNDTLGCAVRDAATFARAAERIGLRPTRVPARR